jgi:lysozyme
MSTNSQNPNGDKELEAGQRAVPALKYAYGLIGVAGAATTIIGSFTSTQIAVVAVVLTLVGMILVWLFSQLTQDTKKADPAARVMVWASVGAFVLCVLLLVSLATWRQPTYLADILGLPQRVNPPSDAKKQLIVAIFATLSIDPTTVDPKVNDDDRAATTFIETYALKFCAATTDTNFRTQMNCGSGSSSLTAQATSAPANLSPPSTIVLNKTTVSSGNPCATTALAKASATPTKIFGLDVSHIDGNVDWTKIVSSGYYFVFIKATQGLSFVDPNFVKNWSAAGQAGLIRGAYHFLGTANGTDEASFFLAALKQVQLGPCDVGAALDLEPNVVGNQPPPQTRVSQAVSWLGAVQAALGKPPILYGGSYLKQLGDLTSLAAYPLWIASYSSSPRLPPSRSSYAFWQFSSDNIGPNMGQLPKISTSLFNGTPAELFALAR